MQLRSSSVIALFALAACPGRDSEQSRALIAAPEPSINRPDQTIGGNIVPRSHEFPVGRAADVRRLFENHAVSYPISVVSSAGVQTQFVHPPPVFIGDHRFVIALPPAIHTALDELIAGFDKQSAHVSSTYEVTFWAVEAVAATESEVPRDLAEVGPMLEKLAGLGKRKFKGLDRVAARSRDGGETKIAGRMMKVEHTLTAFPDGIELDLSLELKGVWSDKPELGPRVETKLALPVDEPIVIGDSAQTAASDGAANLVLYLVRARRLD